MYRGMVLGTLLWIVILLVLGTLIFQGAGPFLILGIGYVLGKFVETDLRTEYQEATRAVYRKESKRFQGDYRHQHSIDEACRYSMKSADSIAKVGFWAMLLCPGLILLYLPWRFLPEKTRRGFLKW